MKTVIAAALAALFLGAPASAATLQNVNTGDKLIEISGEAVYGEGPDTFGVSDVGYTQVRNLQGFSGVGWDAVHFGFSGPVEDPQSALNMSFILQDGIYNGPSWTLGSVVDFEYTSNGLNAILETGNLIDDNVPDQFFVTVRFYFNNPTGGLFESFRADRFGEAEMYISLRDVVPVPLPASLPALGAALYILGLLGSRRRRGRGSLA